MSELQAEFYQKLLEHLEALGNRLSSIEKLLSAESKPEKIKIIDLARCRENLRLTGKPYGRSSCDLCGSLLNHGRKCLKEAAEQQQEPEWRPISEAPRDGRYIKIIANGYEDEMTAWFYVKYKHWVVESGRYPLYMVESCIKGWRPL